MDISDRLLDGISNIGDRHVLNDPCPPRSKQSKRKEKRRGIPAKLAADMMKLAGRCFFGGGW